MTKIKPSNRIYLTYKARIQSEAKPRLFGKLMNFLIIWFSFWMIVASIAEATDTIAILYFEVFFAGASIAIFASSIFLATGTLDKKADEFRDCYLELQGIWNSNISEIQKMKRYSASLRRYPNHSSRDDADMIFQAWRRGGRLYDTEGVVRFSCLIIAPTLLRKAAFWLVVLAVFIAPLCLAPNFVSGT